jgi:DNA polymerase-3 subunit epsilon
VQLSDLIFLGILCCSVVAALLFHHVFRVIQRRRIRRKIAILEGNISKKETEILLLKTELQASLGRWNAAFGRFCSVDVETTGIKRASSKIIQIGLCLFDGGEINGKRIWWIDPGVRIPPSATKVNNIKDSDVRGKGSFSQHSENIKRLLTRYPLVGHNLYFDISMIISEFKRIGQHIEVRSLYCTMRDVWYDEAIEPPAPRDQPRQREMPRWQKLGHLAESLGVLPHGPLHDAFVDARLAGECFIARARQEVGRSEAALQRAEAELVRLRAELDAARAELNTRRRKVWS